MNAQASSSSLLPAARRAMMRIAPRRASRGVSGTGNRFLPAIPTRILLAGADQSLMVALAETIHTQHDMQCECCFPSATALLQSIHAHPPQVVVLDLDSSTLHAVREITAIWPATRMIVLSDNDGETAVDSAIEAGAWGYLSKAADSRGMLEAIRRVIAGEMVLLGEKNS